MAQAYKVRLPDGRIERPTEWSSTPLYSTVDIATGPLVDLQAFSYGVGNSVPGSVGPRKSTDSDTNMQGPGSILPENEELLLYAIMAEFYVVNTTGNIYLLNNDATAPNPPEMSALNMARIQRDTLLVLNIADTKDYLRHPVGFFPAGMGLWTVSGDVRNDLGFAIIGGQNGSPSTYDRRELATPHQVKGGEAFSITLRFPLGTITGLDFGDDTNARIRARIYADGYRKRPVA